MSLSLHTLPLPLCTCALFGSPPLSACYTRDDARTHRPPSPGARKGGRGAHVPALDSACRFALPRSSASSRSPIARIPLRSPSLLHPPLVSQAAVVLSQQTRAFSATAVTQKMKKFSIYRWDPEVPGDKPRQQEYEIDMSQ